MPFEVFDKRAATSSKNPLVTIQKGGYFSLNKAAYKALGEPETVELLFNREEKLIGFRPVASDSPRGFPVRPQGERASTYMVTGRAFSKYYEIDSSIARRYGVEMQDGILVLNLKSPSVDVTGPRAAMKSRLAGGQQPLVPDERESS